MRSRSLFALVAIAAFAILFGQPAPASASHNAPRTFVSTTGNDANLCSAAAPCRTFAVAIGHTAPGGEVLAIDSGGYGPVIIDKSVSIVGAPGAHVAVTATTGNAITVSAGGGSGRVVLRNLYLVGLGATRGVYFSSGAALHIEQLVVSGFPTGIDVEHSGNFDTETFISDTVVRGNTYGIVASGQGPTVARVTMVRGRVEHSVLDGVIAGAYSRFVISDSVSAGNGAFGFYSLVSAQMSLDRCTASGNDTGIYSAGIVDVSNCTITDNTTGISGTGLWSRVNNTLIRNVTDGTFTGTISAQ